MSGESTPIQYSEAIDPSLFPTLLAQMREAVELQKQMEEGFKAILKASGIKGNPTSFADYKQQAADIEKSNSAFKGLNTTQEKHKTLLAQIEAAEKAQINILNQKSKLAKEQIDYKNKIAKQNADEKKAIKETETLQKQKNAADAESIKIAKLKETIAKSEAGSLNQKKAQLALVTLEINRMSEAELKGTEEGKKLIETQLRLTQQLNKTEQAGGNFHRAVGDYTGRLQTLGKGVGGLVGLLGTLGRAIGFDVEQIEILHTASSTIIKATREYSHAIHLEHLAHNENKEAIAGEIVAEKEEAVTKTASLGVIGLVIAATAALVGGIWYLISAQEESKKQLAEETKKLNENEEAIRKNTIARAKLQAGIINTKNETAVLMGKMGEGEQKRREREMEQQIKEGELLSDKLIEIDKENAYYKTQIDENGNALSKNAKIYHQEALANIEKNWHEKRKFAQEQYVADIEKINTESALKEADGLDDNFDKLLEKKKENAKKYAAEVKAEHEKIKQILDDLNKDILPGGVKYEEEVSDADKKRQEDFDKQIEDHVTFAAKDLEIDKKLMEDEAELDRKRKEKRDKKIDEEFEAINKVTDAVEQGLERRNQAQTEALKIQGDQIESELSVQEKLFADGLDNTLAYDEKAKAENTEKELAAQRQAAKEKKSIELAHTYISFLQSYLKDGSSPESAAVKALASTLVSQGIADGIAGSAFDGIEDTGKNADGGLDGKGGKLWMIHPEERIVPKKINRKLAGISNDELGNMFDSDFDDLYRPNFIASIPNDSIGGKGSVDMTTLMELNGKMIRDGIEKGFSKIQVTNYDINVYGKIVENVTSNGISKTYIHQSDVFK